MQESHFIDMIRTIHPHVSGRPKRSVELLLQSADLIRCVHEYQEPALSACDASQDYIDFEAMLTDLQSVCNPAEAELVNLILNFFRSKKIYSSYQMAMQQGRNTDFSPEYTADTENLSADNRKHPGAASAGADRHMDTLPPQQNNGSNIRNLMENPALQSLLTPSQREQLNQLGTFMQAIS